MKRLPQWIYVSSLAVMLSGQSMFAQSVIFPQEEQPGKAVLKSRKGVYALSNDLLCVEFKEDGEKLVFGGCKALNLLPGQDLFMVTFADGTRVSSSEMKLKDVRVKKLTGRKDAVKGAHRFNGRMLEAEYSYGDLDLVWCAVLRDGSHYFRTKLVLNARKDIALSSIIPMQYVVDNEAAGCNAPVTIGNTRGAVLLSDRIFAGLETPMGINTGGSSTLEVNVRELEHWKDDWTPSDWKPVAKVPLRINELGYYGDEVLMLEQPLDIDSDDGMLNVEFCYKTGLHRLNTVGVDLVDSDGNTVVYDYHIGFAGGEKMGNVYSMNVPFSGDFKLRYFVENKTEAIDATGEVNISLSVNDTICHVTPSTTPIQGLWSRNTTLQSGDSWTVSAVVGMVAPDQARRSFLAYSERERAVPWRACPVYISWYELNIDRNNDRDYKTNMNAGQCEEIVRQWKTNLYDRYGESVQSFVWDDGWDIYGKWDFNKNFPDGFHGIDKEARKMRAGIGAWLGPVGGYGMSGNYRRDYWKENGGMQLSNPAYYDVFYKACSKLLNDYDFRFFKFDGISAQFTSVGPDPGTVGEENAEGIIHAEQEMRKVKPDIFFNTTVGTWASPFWFHVTDAIWRQEADYAEIGNNKSDRERWITYRDRLVYQNFVQNSPLCPINTLMTHGFILSKFGQVSKDMDYNGIVREMRCAFACGSGMVELYNDFELMNTICNDRGEAGALWKELADCIAWQRENADVLPDIHWVGGNPWNGIKSQIYGWASWNGKKATLALRNGANEEQVYCATLRQMLEIPAYINTSISLEDAFDQAGIQGIPIGQPVDIDQKLTIVLPASSVYIYNGTDSSAKK